jgi:hypothetical protein
MDGKMIVSYKILCDSDINKEISLHELLSNEKVLKVIKNEFAKGFRNITLSKKEESSSFAIETIKETHTLEVLKDDYADILSLAEDSAKDNKLLKKGCDRVELVDIEIL